MTPKARWPGAFGAVLAGALLFSQQAGANWLGGPGVNAGYAAYCIYEPLPLGGLISFKKKFYRVLIGPDSITMSPRHFRCTPVSLLQVTRDEDFKLLTSDQLEMSFQAHLTYVVDSDPQAIRHLVENYGHIEEEYYRHAIQGPFRTMVRKFVADLSSSELYDSQNRLSDEISQAFNEFFITAPFKLIAVGIGDVKYPVTVQEAIEKKVAAHQHWERKQTEVQIAKAEAEATYERAQGEARARTTQAEAESRALETIGKQLSPELIEYIRAQALLEAAKSPSSKVIYFPINPDHPSSSVQLVQPVEPAS